MLYALVMIIAAASYPGLSDPAPLEPVPSSRQLAWHDLEYYAFVHFNMNTFTDREWGTGHEESALFKPTGLDCRQWARVCKSAGMKGIIITAKHHDGFCLWPSQYTDHTVASSPWQSGKGDVLRDLADACAEFGLKMGVYLSPWDRHQPSYGDSPRYNEFFRNQLTEVLTNYGEIFEVWFDGACGEGPNGKRQVYDWASYVDVVRRHQPGAVIFSDAGPDVRWVGNERGIAHVTNWSLLRRDEFEPGTPRYDELTSGHADGTHWVPAECNTSIRPGWYYHASQDDKVKTVDELVDVYYQSIGMNASLLLNLPVDRRGLVHENDVARLEAFREMIDKTFDQDHALGRPASATTTRGDRSRYSAARAFDGDAATFWATDDDVTTASLEVNLGEAAMFNRIVLQEPIVLGQRVEAFSVSALTDAGWTVVGEGTTIGRKRILRIPGVTASRVRVTITKARACPALSSIELYTAPPTVTIDAPAGAFIGTAEVRMSVDLAGADIRYTVDGSEPTGQSPRYDEPLLIDRRATIKAVAYNGAERSVEVAAVEVRAMSPDDVHAPIVFFRTPDAGLRFAYYEGAWQSLDDFDESGGTEPVARGETTGFDVDVRKRDEHFTLEFRGFVLVPADGVYTFYLSSDDGSRLWVATDLVVDNDGVHGLAQNNGVVGLRAGYHPIALRWFNNTGGFALRVEIEGPKTGRTAIPAFMLYR